MARRQQRRRERRPRSARPAPQVQPPQSAPRALQAAAVFAVFAAAVLAHLQTLHYGFLTSWDDPNYVVDNPWIRGWSRANLWYIFTRPYYANYLPLHLVSYMVDYSVWGSNPFGYHLQSVLLDGVNAVLALLVTRQLFGSFPLAFAAALLFAVHPSHVEAVAWISTRKDLLATAFVLLSVSCYDRAIGSRSLQRGAYLASVGCFTLGLLSKVSIAALPFFLLVLDWLRPAGRQISWKSAIANKLPYLLLALLLVGINTLAQVASPAESASDPLLYLALKGHAVWKYLALLTGLPSGRPVYDAPELAPDLLSLSANLAGFLVLPAAIWLAHRRRWRVLGVGAGWMLAMLAPVILFPLVTYMADRYLYTPSLGFCWLLAAGILAASRRSGSTATAAWVAALLTALPFSLFAYRTLEYNPVWADSQALWSYAVERSRDYRVRNNLGQALVLEQRWAEAEAAYLEASAVENFISHQGLAIVYLNTLHDADAQREIEAALAIAERSRAEPEYMAQLEFTRGEVYWARSRPEAAIEAWEAALRANPHHGPAAERLAAARAGRRAQTP